MKMQIVGMTWNGDAYKAKSENKNIRLFFQKRICLGIIFPYQRMPSMLMQLMLSLTLLRPDIAEIPRQPIFPLPTMQR